MSTDNFGKYIKPIIIGMFIGGMITFSVTSFIAPSSNEQSASAMPDEKKPLYWVAPTAHKNSLINTKFWQK